MASRSEGECMTASLCVRLQGRGHQEFLEFSLPLSQCPKFACFPYLGRNLHFGPQRKWEGVFFLCPHQFPPLILKPKTLQRGF